MNESVETQALHRTTGCFVKGGLFIASGESGATSGMWCSRHLLMFIGYHWNAFMSDQCLLDKTDLRPVTT